MRSSTRPGTTATSSGQFKTLCWTLLGATAVGASLLGAEDASKTVLKTERFDQDPGWEGVRNRVTLKQVPTVTQDFGYSPTNIAGRGKGEIGGRVQRSTTPAYYADKIAVKTLNDKLQATGTFAITATSGSTGVFFGWFNADQPGGSGRPLNSLGLDFDGEGSGARLAVRLIAGTNRACGTFVTPFIPGKFRPTPIRNDGTRYTWVLTYDPDANGGDGQFRFTITSERAQREDFEGKEFTVNLPRGFKQAGATFDRFGLMNLMKSGNPLTIHFDDLQYNGKTEDFSQDPGWLGSGNHVRFADREQAGAHDFGFSAATHFAGGAPGEVGGGLWRSGDYAYYADRVGPLSFDDRLEARGKVVLKVGAPDSDMYIGWFDSGAKDKPPSETGSFVGVHVGGPTRVGHYFHPAFATAKGSKRLAEKGPVLIPGKVYDWSLVYDPAAEAGKGAIHVRLGDESVTLPLKEGQKAEGARMDRFGLFNSNIGGQLVRVYFDDLTYTAARGR